MDRVNDSDQATEERTEGRVAVMEAAAKAFMRNGFAGTAIDDVADELGGTKGRVYHYYRSKADLFFDVHRESMRQNLEGAGAIARETGSPIGRLGRMVRTHALLMMTHLPYQRVSVLGVEMHLAGSTTRRQRETLREVIALRDEYERLFVQVIKDGIGAGEIRPLDAGLVVKGLLGALNWITVWYRERESDTDESRARIADEMTTYLIDGLRRMA
jgi:AcrR family transcriptional regulator